MTNLQQRRQETSRSKAYHNRVPTKVIGIRTSVAIYDVLKESFDRSTGEHADHGFGHWVLHYAIDGILRERSQNGGNGHG